MTMVAKHATREHYQYTACRCPAVGAGGGIAAWWGAGRERFGKAGRACEADRWAVA